MNDIELARKYLSMRALDTGKKSVQSLVKQRTLPQILPASEVDAILEMAINGTLLDFLRETEKFTNMKIFS